MKNLSIYLIALFSIFSNDSFSQIMNIRWTQENQYPQDDDGGRFCATNKFGEVFSIGSQYDSPNMNGIGNGTDVLLKYDINGNLEWSYYTDSDYSGAMSYQYDITFEYINQQEYFVYVLTPFTVAKLKDDGTVLWEYYLGDDFQTFSFWEFYDIQLVNDHLYICGNGNNLIGDNSGIFKGILIQLDKITGTQTFLHSQEGQGGNNNIYNACEYVSMSTDGDDLYILGHPNPLVAYSYLDEVNLVQKFNDNTNTVEWETIYNPFPSIDISSPPADTSIFPGTEKKQTIYFIDNKVFVGGEVALVGVNSTVFIDNSYFYLTKLNATNGTIENEYSNKLPQYGNSYRTNLLFDIAYKCGTFYFSGAVDSTRSTLYDSKGILLKVDTSFTQQWQRIEPVNSAFNSFGRMDVDHYGNIFTSLYSDFTTVFWAIQWINKDGTRIDTLFIENDGVIYDVNVFADSIINLNGFINHGAIGSGEAQTVTRSLYYHNDNDTVLICEPTPIIPTLQEPEPTIEYTDLIFPNIITPNDDGLNDNFKPVDLTLEELINRVDSYNCNIFNRWGKPVFKTSEPAFWDGKINQQKASEGVYYFIVDYKFKNQEEEMKVSGSFSLVR